MAPGSSFSGRSGGSFPEQRLVIEPMRRPAVEFLLRVVHSCGPAMSGIIKVVVSFFRKGEVICSRKVFQNFLLSSYKRLKNIRCSNRKVKRFQKSCWYFMRRSIPKFNMPLQASPRACELLKIGLFKFPSLGAKRPFKYPTISTELPLLKDKFCLR